MRPCVVFYHLLFCVLGGHTDEDISSHKAENQAVENENGFHIDFSSSSTLAFVPARSCHIQFSSDFGTFSPPVFYGDTDMNLWCNWTVLAAPGKHIVVYITGFGTTTDCNENHDEIIFEGVSSSVENSIVYACWNKHTHVFATQALAVSIVLLWHSFSHSTSNKLFKGRYYVFDDPNFKQMAHLWNSTYTITTFPKKLSTTESLLDPSVLPKYSISKIITDDFSGVSDEREEHSLYKTPWTTVKVDEILTLVTDENHLLATSSLVHSFLPSCTTCKELHHLTSHSYDTAEDKEHPYVWTTGDLEPSHVTKWESMTQSIWNLEMSSSQLLPETPNINIAHNIELSKALDFNITHTIGISKTLHFRKDPIITEITNFSLPSVDEHTESPTFTTTFVVEPQENNNASTTPTTELSQGSYFSTVQPTEPIITNFTELLNIIHPSLAPSIEFPYMQHSIVEYFTELSEVPHPSKAPYVEFPERTLLSEATYVKPMQMSYSSSAPYTESSQMPHLDGGSYISLPEIAHHSGVPYVKLSQVPEYSSATYIESSEMIHSTGIPYLELSQLHYPSGVPYIKLPEMPDHSTAPFVEFSNMPRRSGTPYVEFSKMSFQSEPTYIKLPGMTHPTIVPYVDLPDVPHPTRAPSLELPEMLHHSGAPYVELLQMPHSSSAPYVESSQMPHSSSAPYVGLSQMPHSSSAPYVESSQMPHSSSAPYVECSQMPHSSSATYVELLDMSHPSKATYLKLPEMLHPSGAPYFEMPPDSSVVKPLEMPQFSVTHPVEFSDKSHSSAGLSERANANVALSLALPNMSHPNEGPLVELTDMFHPTIVPFIKVTIIAHVSDYHHIDSTEILHSTGDTTDLLGTSDYSLINIPLLSLPGETLEASYATTFLSSTVLINEAIADKAGNEHSQQEKFKFFHNSASRSMGIPVLQTHVFSSPPESTVAITDQQTPTQFPSKFHNKVKLLESVLQIIENNKTNKILNISHKATETPLLKTGYKLTESSKTTLATGKWKPSMYPNNSTTTRMITMEEERIYAYSTNSDVDLNQKDPGQPKSDSLDELPFHGNQTDLGLPHVPGDSLYAVTIEVEQKNIILKELEKELVESLSEKITDKMIYFPNGENSLMLKEIRWTSLNRVILNFWIHLKQGGKEMGNFLKTQLKALESDPLGSFNATLVSFSVEDVNECQLGIQNCSSKAECVNVIGTYSCHCLSGYEDHSPAVPGTICIASRSAEIYSISEHLEILIGCIVSIAATLLLLVAILCVVKHKRRAKVNFNLQDRTTGLPSVHVSHPMTTCRRESGQTPSDPTRRLSLQHTGEHYFARGSSLELTIEKTAC